MSVASMSTSSLFWVVRRKILSRAPPVFSRSARITHHAHHVSIWPSGEVVFQQSLILFVFCALPRPGITSLPCPSGIPLSLASFLFADPAAVLSRCPPSALRVPQAARRLAASDVCELCRATAPFALHISPRSLCLIRVGGFFFPPAPSPGVPASPGVLRYQRRAVAASAAFLCQRLQLLQRAVELARPTRPSLCVIDLTSFPGVPASPGVPGSRSQPREGPPHSWCVWSRRPKAPELPS